MNRFTMGALALLVSACGQAGDAKTNDDLAASTAPVAAAGPAVKSESRTFRDWYAVCDNGNGCAAYSGGSTGWIRIGLDAGPDAAPVIRVGMWPDGDALPGPIAIVIDGKRHATTPGPDETSSAIVATADARAVIADLAAGRALNLTAGGQSVEIPVTGSSASLLWIDERQGRLDTVTALVRRGQKAASTVPTAPALPIVVAAPAVSQAGFAMAPSTDEDDSHNFVAPAALEAVPAVKQCRADTDFNAYIQKAVTAARLNATTELWGVPCDSGAYNVIYQFYLTGPGGTHPRRAVFPGLDGVVAPLAEGDTDGLINGVYDPETRTLNAFAKARGLGDCGVSQTWTWTGQAFALSSEQVMSDCWGMVSDFWPTTFRSR